VHNFTDALRLASLVLLAAAALVMYSLVVLRCQGPIRKGS
jgi:hypothetical protein